MTHPGQRGRAAESRPSRSSGTVCFRGQAEVGWGTKAADHVTVSDMANLVGVTLPQLVANISHVHLVT
jgi:hypothetical protein